jgi:subtilase family serine protease
MLNGTSMSTPITAGVAALVASMLGAYSGNYYQALEVKNILLKSADVVPGLSVSADGAPMDVMYVGFS